MMTDHLREPGTGPMLMKGGGSAANMAELLELLLKKKS
jgi:hypothetical protein